MTAMGVAQEDTQDLACAKHLLENPNLAVKIVHALGTPIEKGFEFLPVRWQAVVQKTTKASLEKAFKFAVLTMNERAKAPASNRAHKMLVAATGAAGGAFGLSALAVELPISVTIMLRSIADIARSQGEQVGLVETRLACLEVFALGGPSKADDAAETGYFAVRTALARAVSQTAEHIAQRGLTRQGAPALLRFMAAVAERFGVVVSQKVAAQALPLIGSAGGALINALFIGHFQDLARGHFTIRRLERKYGSDVVKQVYDSLSV
jgi:hypothetical protein